MPFRDWLNKARVTFSVNVEARRLVRQTKRGFIIPEVDSIAISRPSLLVFARDYSNSTDIETKLQPFIDRSQENVESFGCHAFFFKNSGPIQVISPPFMFYVCDYGIWYEFKNELEKRFDLIVPDGQFSTCDQVHISLYYSKTGSKNLRSYIFQSFNSSSGLFSFQQIKINNADCRLSWRYPFV